MLDSIRSLDASFFLLLNRDLAHPLLDAFFVTITNGKFWIIPGIAAALLYLKFEKKRAALVLLLSAVTVALTDPVAAQIIKPLVHRLRPCNPEHLVEGGRFLTGLKTSFSFPSNHAMNMFGQAMLFTLFYPKRGALFFLFAAAIGYSRIYVGVHWPTDVIGGAVMGMAAGAAVYGGYALIKRRAKGEKKQAVGTTNPFR